MSYPRLDSFPQFKKLVYRALKFILTDSAYSTWIFNDGLETIELNTKSPVNGTFTIGTSNVTIVNGLITNIVNPN